MQEWIRSLSARTEFIIVVLVAFGYFMLGSLLSVLFPADSAHISEQHLRFLLVYEVLIFTVLWLLLSLRGWRLRDLGITVSLRDTLIGVGFVVLTYSIYILLWLLFSGFFPELNYASHKLIAADIAMPTLIAISFVNPVFEEVFVCAYVINVLKKSRGLQFAVNVSIAIRLTYHLYQGVLSLFTALPVGILFAYWYARTGRLWPLLVAHGIVDFIGMLSFVKH